MGNLGWTEMFFIVAFALIVFGPRKLPEIAKTLGHAVAQLRRASEEFKKTWEAEVDREVTKIEQPKPATNTQMQTAGTADPAEAAQPEMDPEIANEISAGMADNLAAIDAPADSGVESGVESGVNVARGRLVYDDIVPEPEQSQPPMIGATDSNSSGTALKSDEKHPVSIA